MKLGYLRVGAGLALGLLAACDDRPTEPALVAVADGHIAFGGDESACLQRAYVRNEDADEDEEAYVWTVEAREGGCMRFPLVFGTTPEGAEEMSGSALLKANARYHFETGTTEQRWVADFEPASSNGIFYVRDRNGEWTDINKAEQ